MKPLSRLASPRPVNYYQFKSGRKFYVYDTTTNACVQIPKALAQVLDDALSQGADVVRRRHRGQIKGRAVSAALTELREHQETRGMFQPAPILEFASVLSKKNVEQSIAATCRHLKLNVTENCNLRCLYCVYSGDFPAERSHSSKKMSWPVAKKAIDYLLTRTKSTHASRLSFYGGEALLNWALVKQCVEYVRSAAAGQNVIIDLSTNLTPMTESIAQFLASSRVKLEVSLDGPKSIHDASRVFSDGRGSHQMVVDRLGSLLRSDPEYWKSALTLKCTIDWDNDLCELLSYFSQEPFVDLDVVTNPLHGPRSNKTDAWTLAARMAQTDRLVAAYLAAIDEGRPVNHLFFQRVLKIVYTRVARRQLGAAVWAEFAGRVCVPGVNAIFADADGQLFVCENFAHESLRVGDVDTGIDVEKVLPIVERFAGFCAESCGSCWASRLCTICHVHTLETGEVSLKRMHENCEEQRLRIAKALERFVYLWEHEPAAFRASKFSIRKAGLAQV